MDTWLVTGARGFLGTNAGTFLQRRVRLIGQARTSAISSLYEVVEGLDLRNTSEIADLVRRVRPDVILHTAAVSGHETSANDPDQAQAVNAIATGILAETAHEIGARMVHISTDALFSGERGDYREGDEVEPFSVYGETKYAGEEAIRNALANHLIVRTNFFGWSETGHKSVLEFFVNSLRAGQNVRGYPNFIVTSMYVQDLLMSIWQLDELGVTGTVNVASRDALSKYSFGVEVARTFRLDPGLISKLGPLDSAHTTSRARNLSLNTDFVSALLGRQFPTQAEGIEKASIDESDLAPRILRQ